MRPRRIALVAAALVLIGGVIAVVASSGGPHRRPAASAPARPRAPAPRPASPAPLAPAVHGGVQFGADAGSLFERPAPLGAAELAADLAALNRSGGSVVREDALWEASEPAAPVGGVHRYDWSFDDAIARSLATAGLRWLAVIDYAPGWAQASAAVGAVHPPPRDDGAYAAYAAAFAARYGAGGAFWRAHPELPALPVDTIELWNEPDNPTFWYPRPDLRAYATLYAFAEAAIHAVAPAVRVLVAGLNHPTLSLPALIPALRAVHAPIAGISIHPYAPTPAGVLAGVRASRRALRALHAGELPLYVTEFGWTVRPAGALDYAPPALRPGYVRETLDALGHSDCGIAAVTVYSWVSLEANPLGYGDWFGLQPPDGADSPDRDAYAAGVRAALAPAPVAPICAG